VDFWIHKTYCLGLCEQYGASSRFVSVFPPGVQYDACKGSERMTSRVSATCERSDGRDLAQWRVAPASVLQYGHYRVAGRFRFGEHDAAGMERSGEHGYVRLYCTSPWAPAVEWRRCDANAVQTLSQTREGALSTRKGFIACEIAHRNGDDADNTDTLYLPLMLL